MFRNTECPSCGAPLSFSLDQKEIVCYYCNSTFTIVTKDNQNLFERTGFLYEQTHENNIIIQDRVGNDAKTEEQIFLSDVSESVKPHVVSSFEEPKKSVKSKQPLPKKNRKKLLIIAVPVLFLFCCLALFILVTLSPSTENNTQLVNQQSISLSFTPTLAVSPTPSPTVFFVKLPYPITTSKGWNFSVDRLDILDRISNTTPKKEKFLIVLLSAKKPQLRGLFTYG